MQRLAATTPLQASSLSSGCRGRSHNCRPFYPEPVLVRLSDFKTNDYASLIGRAAFEPRSPSRCWAFAALHAMHIPPMRRDWPSNAPRWSVFAITMGPTNVIFMVPF